LLEGGRQTSQNNCIARRHQRELSLGEHTHIHTETHQAAHVNKVTCDTHMPTDMSRWEVPLSKSHSDTYENILRYNTNTQSTYPQRCRRADLSIQIQSPRTCIMSVAVHLTDILEAYYVLSPLLLSSGDNLFCALGENEVPGGSRH
jgi:hypothetical protein